MGHGDDFAKTFGAEKYEIFEMLEREIKWIGAEIYMGKKQEMESFYIPP